MGDLRLESGELMMGVGNGGGNLFVKGDYDSITVLQQKLFELEEYRRGEHQNEEVKRLKEEVENLKDELLRVKLELASEKANREINRRGGYRPTPFDPCLQPERLYPTYPGRDIIWSKTTTKTV